MASVIARWMSATFAMTSRTRARARQIGVDGLERGPQVSAGGFFEFEEPVTDANVVKHLIGPSENHDYKFKPHVSLEYSESFLNQRLGIMLSASRANSYTEQYSFVHDYNRNPTTADPRPRVIRQIDFKNGPKTIFKEALSLTADCVG